MWKQRSGPILVWAIFDKLVNIFDKFWPFGIKLYWWFKLWSVHTVQSLGGASARLWTCKKNVRICILESHENVYVWLYIDLHFQIRNLAIVLGMKVLETSKIIHLKIFKACFFQLILKSHVFHGFWLRLFFVFILKAIWTSFWSAVEIADTF